jgi:hypothetical protein
MVFDNWLEKNFYIPSVYSNVQDPEKVIELHSNAPVNEPKNIPSQSNPAEIINVPNNKTNSFLIKNSTSQEYNGKVFISLMLVSNILMLIGVFAAKYFVEFPDSYFFKSFKNCFDLKSKYDSSFSSKIVRDGGAFNIFFGIFAAHFSSQNKINNTPSSPTSSPKSSINIFQAMLTNFDDNTKYMLIRLFTIIFLLSPCLLTFIIGPKFNGILGISANLSLGLGLPFLCGYYLRYGYLGILNFLSVPYFQFDNPKGLKEPQQVNNN